MINAPEGEILWVQILRDEVVTYVITSTPLRDTYYLYKVQNGKLKRTRYQSDDPTELERKIK